MARIGKLDIYGPLSSDLSHNNIVPVHKFFLTGKFDAQITHLNTDMTIRRIRNTSASAGVVRAILADGTTLAEPIEANSTILGFYNQILTAGTTIAASSLIGEV